MRSARDSLVGMEPAEELRIQRRVIHGFSWTFRARFARVFERAPAAAWTDPEAQGWQRIKRNATRTVWRGRIDGSVYYLKYYRSFGWSAPFKRLLRGSACELEWNNGFYALRAGIPAVRPVGYADCVSYGGQLCALLVTEAVEPAYPLNEYWRMIWKDDDARRQRRDIVDLVDLLAEMIARAHQAGFEHRDMHAANTLVHPVGPGRYRTLLVDLHSARLGRPLSDRAVVRNLSQLNQWFRRHSSIKDRLRFLRRYLRWRNEYEPVFEHGRALDSSFEQLVRALVERAERHARGLWAKRDRRARRNGRYFARISVSGGWVGMVSLQSKRPIEGSRASSLVLDRAWWRGQLANPLRWFEVDNGRVCKDSHSAWVTQAVLAAEAEQLPVIVKRPRARNWRRAVRQLFAPSRSARGWRVGHALLNRDIPAARPLAVLERRLGPLVFDSLLVTETIPGAVDLETCVRREFERRAPAAWWRFKRALHARLVRHVRQLAERGFAHRDCKAQNVLVVTQPHLRLFWVDMDGVKQVRHVAEADELRALVRLHVSLQGVPGLTRTDRVRFLKDYLRRFGFDPCRTWRGIWNALSQASVQKARAKQLRSQWKLKRYGRP